MTKLYKDKMRLREKSLLCLILLREMYSVKREKRRLSVFEKETGIEAAENFFRVYENFSQKLLGGT